MYFSAVRCANQSGWTSHRSDGISLLTLMSPNVQGVTRLEPVRRFGYVAEIFSSPWTGGTMFHYVVQREGNTSIIHFGQEVSEQRAREVVDEVLSTLAPRAQSA
jgi:hypothetical protein